MSTLQSFLNSLLGQFMIGGTTVSGISYFSKNFSTLAASIIGGVPIGLPSALFIDDKNVLSYLQNLSVMTFILFFVTTMSFVIMKYEKYDKYKTISISLGTWVALSIFYYIPFHLTGFPKDLTLYWEAGYKYLDHFLHNKLHILI